MATESNRSDALPSEVSGAGTLPSFTALSAPAAFSETAARPAAAAPGQTATLSPAEALAQARAAAPAHVPGYEILGELGRGGMGVVYKARHVALNRLVALKMILAGDHAGPDHLARFRAEAQALARLQHPHIVQVHEVGAYDGRPYFSLEFVEGGSLDKKLTGTPVPPRQSAQMVETLARAMHAAHQAGIVHRDLKPANVLVGAKWTLKVTDFGLAKRLDEEGQTRTGAVMGTPSYMAPEQAGGKNKEVGPAADVYALGAILYQCLTGRPPFKAPTAVETLMQVVQDEPVGPRQLQSRTPRDLETICLKCLQKDARKRYASAEALAEDLRRFQAGEPIAARPVGPAERAVKWARRRPAVAGLLALSVLLLLGGMAVSSWLAVVASIRAGQAETNARTADAEKKKTTAALAKAEESLADGLARPLGPSRQPMSPNELSALWYLAALPKEQDRVRILFIDRALEGPATAEQLERRVGPAVHAAVGLDRGRRDEVRKRVRARLEGPGADLRVRAAAAAMAAELEPDEAFADEAARALMEAAGKTQDADVSRDLAEDVAALAPKVSRDGAESAARGLVDAMDKAPPRVREGLAQAVRVLAPRLGAKAAGASADRILDAVEKTANEAAAVRLNTNERFEPLPIHGALCDALEGLGPRLDEAAAAGIVRRILDTLNRKPTFEMPDPFANTYRPHLSALMEALAPRLNEAAAAAAVGRLIDAVPQKPTFGMLQPPVADNFRGALGALAPRISPAAAAAAADRLLDMAAVPQTPGTLGSLHADFASFYAGLAPRLERAAAAAAADRILAAMAKVISEAPPTTKFGSDRDWRLGDLCRSLEALAPKLDEAASQKSAHRILEGMALPQNGLLLDPGVSARTLAALAPRLDGPTAAASADRLLEAAKLFAQTPVPLKEHLDAIGVLAARLDEDAAAATAKRLRDEIAGAAKPGAPSVLLMQVHILGTLRSRMGEGRAAAARQEDARAAAAAVKPLLDQMAGAADKNSLATAAGQVAALAPLMEARAGRAAAAAVMKTLLDGIIEQNLPPGNSSLGGPVEESLKLLGGQLDEAAAMDAANKILDVPESSTDARGQITTTLAALAPRLGGAGSAMARRVLDAAAADPTAPNLRLFAPAVVALAPQMDGAEAARVADLYLDAMSRIPDVSDRAGLAVVLAPLAARMGEGAAAAAAGRFLDRTACDGPPIRYPGASLFPSLIQLRLPNPAVTGDWTVTGWSPARPEDADAFGTLTDRLGTQARVNLLKHPACLGAARGVVLDRLGKRLGRPFADVWELADWLAEHEPDVDVLSPSAPPGR